MVKFTEQFFGDSPVLHAFQSDDFGDSDELYAVVFEVRFDFVLDPEELLHVTVGINSDKQKVLPCQFVLLESYQGVIFCWSFINALFQPFL